MDKDISDEFSKILKKQGIKFKLDSKVTKISIINGRAVVDFTNNKSAKNESIECDKVLVAVGRKPNVDNNLTNLKIKLNKQSKIIVDDN